jgi:hypothetical protein
MAFQVRKRFGLDYNAPLISYSRFRHSATPTGLMGNSMAAVPRGDY